jgi:hypothetical protein
MLADTVRSGFVFGACRILRDRFWSRVTASDVGKIQPVTDRSAPQSDQWQSAYAYKNLDGAGHGCLLYSLCRVVLRDIEMPPG